MWVRILSTINSLVENIVTILTATGSEPATGDETSIENSNKLIYDELTALGQFITYPIPVEYHTISEAKRFELELYGSSGGQNYGYTYSGFPFAYNGELGVLYSVSNNRKYIYLYSSNSYEEINCTIQNITYVEYSGGLFVYGITSDANTGVETYIKQSFDANFSFLSTEVLSSPYYGADSEFVDIQKRAEYGSPWYAGAIVNSGSFVKIGVLHHCLLSGIPPQKIENGWFISSVDKCLFLDEDYIPTRMIQFNDPTLIGYTPTTLPNLNDNNIYFYLDYIYAICKDGRIERYTID